MMEGEVFGQMLAQGLNAIAFSGVMARSIEVNPAFPGNMHGALRYLAGKAGIDTPGRGGLEIILRRPGAPGDAVNLLTGPRNVQRRPRQGSGKPFAERRYAQWPGQGSLHHQTGPTAGQFR